MASIVGKDVTNMKIMPILSDLFKDDNPDVRLSVTDGIFLLADVLGPDMLNHTLTTQLQALTNDEQWRVRMAGYDLIANLGRTFGVQAFTAQLQSIFFGFFLETASQARHRGSFKAGELAQVFKNEWVVNELMPKVQETFAIEKQGYLYRMNCVKCIGEVASLMTKEQMTHQCVSLIVKALKDTVPNVRFVTA
jgi:serine/threonine-protein phosphatase 2A regulatory subunit A